MKRKGQDSSPWHWETIKHFLQFPNILQEPLLRAENFWIITISSLWFLLGHSKIHFKAAEALVHSASFTAECLIQESGTSFLKWNPFLLPVSCNFSET